MLSYPSSLNIEAPKCLLQIPVDDPPKIIPTLNETLGDLPAVQNRKAWPFVDELL